MIGLKKGKMSIIVGGQAGSEAKGKFSGYLCRRFNPDLLVMTASPNAGHTVVLGGKKYVSYHLPIGMATCSCPVVLTAASLINVDILRKEIKDLGVDPSRIFVDPRASIITRDLVEAEENKGLSDIGSTLQGIGETRMLKMRRDGRVVLASDLEEDLTGMGLSLTVGPSSRHINAFLRDRLSVLCEMTQGFDLDLEHGIHPRYCTSKMINPSMGMAEAGVSPALVGDIFGVIRPYPIRVNNRTGTSGPYAEALEIGWATVADRCGYPYPFDDFGEITTTTKLPRRVFEFSWSRFGAFIRVCRPSSLCLQFANYLDWSVFRTLKLTDPVLSFIRRLQQEGGVPVDFVGTGPEDEWMVELEEGCDDGN